ncbi:hypothetical protein BFX06_13875 [Sulfobacillus thermosulfidooxidans]|nr:hypothetical protein BFX05_10665 [Sulfobacillus thermosulfidooxidans]OLZ17027.1 hypothetical protein BFX06_13875 [Sulfobacillus thermosulfidooxidans]OLZ20123.1 hypothetical protein BFX07_00605 [Sulfobacillus thermosulfidooxidans]
MRAHQSKPLHRKRLRIFCFAFPRKLLDPYEYTNRPIHDGLVLNDGQKWMTQMFIYPGKVAFTGVKISTTKGRERLSL